MLRSIGLTKDESNKIFFYEASTIMIASYVTGISIGLLTTLLAASLYGQLTEQPRSLTVPYGEISFILVLCAIATYLAVRIPAFALNTKQISSVLKGN